MSGLEIALMVFVFYLCLMNYLGQKDFDKRVSEVGLGKAWEEAAEIRKKNGWD